MEPTAVKIDVVAENDSDAQGNLAQLLPAADAKLLMAFCRAGDLYAIERWIDGGKSLQTSTKFTKTPLHTAIELGFHSLVKLLVRNEVRQETKDHALLAAAAKKRLDLVKLLVVHGAQTRSVPLADVLLTGNPQTIRLFLKNGADAIGGSPFAAAFRARVGAALRPYTDYKKAHLEIATELQEQTDRALRQLAFEGDLEWISVLLSAGADPRSCGPSDDGCEDPACHSTALQGACYGDHLEVLKGFNPDPARDDLPDLLSCAVALGSNEAIQYLLRMGVNPNDKPNGGSSALDRCFWNLALAGIGSFLHKQLVSRMAARLVLESTRDLALHGAFMETGRR